MVLPGVLLFPHALLPLYIFEPRYREMIEFCLESDRMFCIAPMKPDVSEAHHEDDFFHTVGLGLVRACVGRDDGTSHLVLQGVARVQITSFDQATPFWIAQLRELKSVPIEPLERETLLVELRELSARFREEMSNVPESLDAQLAKLEDAEVLCDVIAHTFLRDSLQRQEIFEELRVTERIRLLLSYLRSEL